MCAFFFGYGLICLNLQQLRILRETARRAFSLTQAAAALGTSQPALSRSILELEAELGLSIFVRRGKRILGLSEPGTEILKRAEKILAEIDSIESLTDEFRARDDGVLRIATTHTQARYVLPPVVKEFLKRYPAVRLKLVQGSPKQITEAVRNREADFAIATEVLADDPDLHGYPAFDWEHWVVAPKGHPITKGPLSLQTLAKFPLVTYAEEFAGRRKIDQAFDTAGLNPDVVLAAIDSDVIKTYVGLGVGVGIVAAMAYDIKRDTDLVGMAAGHLFGINTTRVAVRKDMYLRGFALAFLELFAPQAPDSFKQTEHE
jgi:LysR family transcriptional regulator, cys regulon transcriptional activator